MNCLLDLLFLHLVRAISPSFCRCCSDGARISDLAPQLNVAPYHHQWRYEPHRAASFLMFVGTRWIPQSYTSPERLIDPPPMKVERSHCLCQERGSRHRADFSNRSPVRFETVAA